MTTVIIRVFYFMFWDVKENFIPDMWKIVLANVAVIIHPYVN